MSDCPPQPPLDAVLAELRQARPRPRHLSIGALLVEYERLAKAGNTAAAVRVETLRRQLAANTEGTTP